MKRWMTFGLTIALSALLSVSFAQHDHDHEGDIHLGAMDGAAAVIEPKSLPSRPIASATRWKSCCQGCSASMSAGTSTPKRATTTRNCAK
jgi:hypothetical protein